MNLTSPVAPAPPVSCFKFVCFVQVKKLKAQLEQKTQKNGTDTSPDAEIIENGNDPNIMELQSKSNKSETAC